MSVPELTFVLLMAAVLGGLLAEAGTVSAQSGGVQRLLRLRRAPLRISRISKFRPEDPTSTRPNPVTTTSPSKPGSSSLHSPGEAQVVTSLLRSHTAWPVWRPPSSVTTDAPPSTAEPGGTAGVEGQVERTTVSEVTVPTEASAGLNYQTEHPEHRLQMEHWSEHSEHSELHVQTERPEPHIERPETPIDPRPGVDLELQPESDPPNEDPELQEWPEHHPEPHLQTEPPEIHPQTEPWPEPGPEPADSGGGSETAPGQLLTEPPSSALTERLEDISARIQLVRQKLSQRLDSQMRISGTGNSLVTLAVLALGVLLFDAINDALAGGGGGRSAGGLWNHLLGPELLRWATPPDRWDRLLEELDDEEASAGREVLLPGPGIIGEYINSLLEIGLNMITVWMHGEAGSQCGRRLLCELNQKARSQSALHSALTYTGGLLLSLLLPEASPSDHLLAMRQGRRGADCLATFDRCQVTL